LKIINNTLTIKQNLISVSSPLIKDVSNNITIDLSSYSTTGNDPNYLKLNGGSMSGQITGIANLSVTTGIFETISTTNNSNQGTPSVGYFGGTAHKIILNNGTPTTYPMSIGVESGSLWMSSPNSIKFYHDMPIIYNQVIF